MDAESTALDEQTGHSRHLRAVLRTARERAGLTQQQIADRITQRLQLEKPLSGSTVSEWERFGRHPAINMMAGWCRVLGLRLLVDIDASAGDRIPVLVRPESADLARTIDLLSDDDRELVRQMVARMKLRGERV